MASGRDDEPDDERAGAVLSEFAQRVLEVVERIPAGSVLTYGDVAEYLGTSSARGVGAVMARYGGGVAWWRVLRADGSVVPPLADRAFEHFRAEGTPVRGRRVDLARARWDGR